MQFPAQALAGGRTGTAAGLRSGRGRPIPAARAIHLATRRQGPDLAWAGTKSPSGPTKLWAELGEPPRTDDKAIDEIRRGEAKLFKATKQVNVLEKGRWLLLKRPENLSEKQTVRLGELLKLNLASIKGYLMPCCSSSASGS